MDEELKKMTQETAKKLFGKGIKVDPPYKLIIEGRPCYTACIYPFTAYIEQTPTYWYWDLSDRAGSIDTGNVHSREQAISTVNAKAAGLVRGIISLASLQTHTERS